ncbi:cytoskeleton-associated protein 2-like [Myripristis murdjan]|uniref:Cytoskeleton associated protein 2-like n=1 Tax=Myripristis murdjan TaxID=586833 RepID=A0A667WBV6_9TELE|nr:cytoskeleton-associated protein 2-like [Myripristis murdjan]
MDEGETASMPSRKELRKQKLMEYLAAKGKLKLPNPSLNHRDDCQAKNRTASALKPVKGKENKAPHAVNTTKEGVKGQPQTAKASAHPTKTYCNVINKVNVQKGDLTGAQNANPAALRDPTWTKLNHNPAAPRIYTIASLKSSLIATIPPKTQPHTGKCFSKAAPTTLSKPKSKINSGPNAPPVGPSKTVGVRMSLGPIVKTRTGLIPAVVQPRNSMSNVSCSSTAATATTSTSVANRGRSALSGCISQRSDLSQRKTAVNKPVQKTTTATGTASTGIKTQAQSKSNSKALQNKPLYQSRKSQPSAGLRSTNVYTRRTMAPIKPEERERLSKTAKSAAGPTNKVAQQRPVFAEAGIGQPHKVRSTASLGAVSRSTSRATNRVMQAAVTELGGKAKICKGMEKMKGENSVKVPPPPPADSKRTAAPLMPQTVPRLARSASQGGQATDIKTPRAPVRVIPQTEGKKMTAAQEERMRKLQEWRESKGISYKRPPMPVKPQARRTVAFPQPYWATMKEEDEAHSLICAVDRSLADCIKLLGEGCSADQVKEVLSRLPPVAQKFSKYWICQARLMEQQGNLDVLPMFEEAVRIVLEPVDELRTVVFEILKKKDEIQGPSSVSQVEIEEDQMPTPRDCTPEDTYNPMVTPKPVKALICGEKGDSAVVKYKITATPGRVHCQQKEPARVNGQEVRFFTPVRRSVRIERASLIYPASLRDHDLCVASYDDLIAEEEKDRKRESEETSPSTHDTPVYVYRENEALKDQVLVQLVYDDDDDD